ncbi:MAG: hypothetical protein ACJ73D_04480 [Pyrinomonadaceae bacterium]
MKRLSETSALPRLRKIKDELRSQASVYEQNASSCATCLTPGACCLDEHFVNVHISRLEAVAIATVLDQLPAIRRAAAEERIANTASRLSKNGGLRAATFACPLYEKGTGCLVHDEAKPVPCILHGCYQRAEDLPPDSLQDIAESAVNRLNERVYGHSTFEPLPVAVHAILRTRRMKAMTSPARNHAAT